MHLIEINQSREVKRCSLFHLQRVTTRSGEQLLLKSSVSEDGETDLLKHEQNTFCRIASRRVAKSVGLVHVRDRPGACYADFPGRPLESTRSLELKEITQLTLELCGILDDFHDAGFLILGLAPTSILRDATGRLQLIDAPFAQESARTFVHRESDWVKSPFLPYAAPEAIRALSRPLDHAADLYALGALLYELFGRRTPFPGRDPGELIQSHMARQPTPLSELAPELPSQVASAVMQLLAKNPVQRPASVSDFLHACQLPPLGTRDTSSLDSPKTAARLRHPLSTRFHGREAILLDLRSKLEDSAGRSITMVEGEPGSGKTSLLEELRKAPFVTTSCWGKFTHGGTSQPLSGWVALARGLAEAALGTSPNEFDDLRTKVEEALGASAQVLVSLAEEWDAVLHCGSGPAEHVEGGLNRTAVALQRLLGSYTDPATPMWVFLDDLQWADASSLRILELILTLPNCNLRVIASVRSPEPEEDRRALTTLKDDLRRNGVEVGVLALDGFGAADLRALLLDGFGADLDGLDELLRFLTDRTHGNPFFVRELLDVLIRESVLVRTSGRWRFSEPATQIALPNSLLDSLMRRVHELSESTKRLLVVAACIGEGVRRSDLCAATGLDADAVNRELAGVVAAGLLHRDDGGHRDDPSYAFAHDRILEASLALASDEERVTLSMRLFHLLAAETKASDRVLTFTLANLFNAGSANVDADTGRLTGATVNQAAGRAAMAKGAYAQALHYLERSVESLQKLPSDARWRDHPELTRSVYCETAEAALLCNRFELNSELCDEVLAHSSTTLEKAPAHELLIRGLAARKRFGEAVVKALDVQAELKIRYPRNPSMGHVIWGYIWTLRKVKALGADHLLRLPPREDPEIAAASRLMQAVFAITHFHKPELYPLFVFRQVEQCVTHGNDAYAAQAYSALSMILAGLGEAELAERICKMSVELTQTPPGDKLRCRSLFVLNSFVVPWLYPVRDSFPQLARAAQAALEHGDFEFFGYAVTMRGLGQLYTAGGLAELTAEFEKTLSQLGALGHERNVLMQSILCEAAQELRHGIPVGPLSGPYYQKVEGLARCQDPMDHTLVFHHYLAELCVSAHFGDVESAVRVVELAKPHLANGAFGSYLLAPFLFYEAWALGASAPLPGHSAFKARRRLAQSEKQLRKWRKSAPMNFDSKWHFVQAERLRLSGRHDEALKSYESAIEESRAQGNYNEAAVVHERAATLWLERGFARLAGQHLRDAHALYVHWGAVAAAERLTTAYPEHVSLFPARPSSPGEAPRSSESLDYHALIKASQAISGETLQPRLLERLLQTIMEHTAAQRGVLLLEQRGQLMVEAEADVDRPHVELIANETAESTTRVSRSIVRYAVRLEKTVVLAEATEDATFGRDPYVQTQRPRSVLCTPILHQGKLLGLIYLENNRVGHVFTRARLEMVSLLASQAAISIGNARLHALKLEAQQAKISPHFLFNALSSIAELAIVDGTKAESAIVKLAHLYRYILASSPTEMVSLERELSIVRDYLGLEKLRFGAKLDFSVSHEGPLDEVRVPGLLIQPLVENSIRHAVAPKLGDGHVWVHARVHANGCTIVVQDDGDGTKHASTGTGFGLRSVQQRLELVYGTRYSFAISQRGGYRVELEIPHQATSQLN